MTLAGLDDTADGDVGAIHQACALGHVKVTHQDRLVTIEIADIEGEAVGNVFDRTADAYSTLGDDQDPFVFEPFGDPYCADRHQIVCDLTRYCNPKIDVGDVAVDGVELILLDDDVELFVTDFDGKREGLLVAYGSDEFTPLEGCVDIVQAFGVDVSDQITISFELLGAALSDTLSYDTF
jgi:hypothetical protein